MRISRVVLLLGSLAAWHSATADSVVAQVRAAGGLRPARPEGGFRLGYDFTGHGPGAGIQVKLPFARVLDFMPSADWVVSGTQDGWQWNIDGAIRLGPRQALYVGGGAGIANRVTNGNVLVGLAPARREPGRQAHGYAEARWTLTQPARFMFVLGINFRLGY